MNPVSVIPTKLTLLQRTHARRKRTERLVDEQAMDPIVHCTEKGWRSSWHERMAEHEEAYDDRAFRIGEPLDFSPGA
jgi:hypothetical protein